MSNKDIDNQLLPSTGIPVSEDNFIESESKVLNSSEIKATKNEDNKNIWNIDTIQSIFTSGLAGIDINNSKMFDLSKFNDIFTKNKEKSKESQKLNDLNKLNNLSEETKKVSLYDLPISEIVINIKNTWFNILDDILNQDYDIDIFIKENRLFYIGITILFFAVIIYLCSSLLDN